jgi:ubiquinone/menaquinone biosynthesis C-methylase UbiE
MLDLFKTPDAVVNVAAFVRDPWVKAKAASLAPGTRVLDVGAGECQYRPLFSHCNYKTQDFVQYHGTSTGTQTETWKYGPIDYVSDITAIPVPDGAFEAVLCTEVLEHLPRPIDALKEISRILAPGGRLFLTAPFSSGLHQQPYHYYGGFSPHFYKKFLPELHMNIVEMMPTGGLMKHVGQEIHRVGRLMEERMPQKRSVLKRFVLMQWLPKYLLKLDTELFIEEFTIGYLVEAVKEQTALP